MRIERMYDGMYLEYDKVSIGKMIDTGNCLFIKTRSGAVDLETGVLTRFDEHELCRVVDVTILVKDIPNNEDCAYIKETPDDRPRTN